MNRARKPPTNAAPAAGADLQRLQGEGCEPERHDHEHDKPGPIEQRRRAALERGRRTRSHHAPVQLAHEGAVVLVPALLLEHAFPRARRDRQLRPARGPNFGDEAPRLHRHRAKRQPDTGDAVVGRAPLVPPDAPFKRVGRQPELPRRAEQRRLVGVGRIAAVGRIDARRHDSSLYHQGSGASLSTRRNCGNAHIQTSMTTMAPKPPISAAGHRAEPGGNRRRRETRRAYPTSP